MVISKRLRAVAIGVLALTVAGGVSAAEAVSGSPSTADSFNPVTQTRVFDSGRMAGDAMLSSGAKQVITLPSGLVPAGAAAVEVQLTAASETAVSGDLEAYPDGTSHTAGATSNLNYTRNVPITSSTVVKLGSDGKFVVYNHGGTAGKLRLIVDVLGYYTAASTYTPPQTVSTTADTGVNGKPITTGGSFVTNAVDTVDLVLPAGTYQVSVNAKATPVSPTGDVQIFPQFFVYNQTKNANFTGDEFNIGSGSLESGANANIDSYFSGSGLVTVPSGSETLHVYSFGYDSDRGQGSYTLDSLSVVAVPVAVASN